MADRILRAPPVRSSFSIRQLCDEFGVTPRALRFYEAKGLVQPERKGAERRYSPQHRRRVAMIVRAKDMGLALGEIWELLKAYEVGGKEGWNAKAAPILVRRLTRLRTERARLEAAISALETACEQVGVGPADLQGEDRENVEFPFRKRRGLGRG